MAAKKINPALSNTGNEYVSFEQMVLTGVLNKTVVDTDSATNNLDAARIIANANPTQVIVSRSNPGNHILAMAGLSADEAIARLLSQRMNTTEALAQFGRVLSTPSHLSQAIEKLFKRTDVPLKMRGYQVSEQMVESLMPSVIPDAPEEVQAAYAHVICRILEARSLLVLSPAKQLVFSHAQYTASVNDIRTALLIDSIKGLFDETRIKSTMAAISDELTPRLLAERLGVLFRGFAAAIPQIALELSYLDIAMFTVNEYLVSPETLPLELRANSALASLAGYANIVLAVAALRDFDPSAQTESIETRSRACEHVLKAIASTDMLETMELSKYSEMFYIAPATSADGERRGAVIARRFGQKSRMTVVDVYAEAGVTRMSEQDSALVSAGVLAPMVDQNLTSDEAVTGIVNLLADDLATKLVDGTPYGKPELWSFQVDPQDLVYLAMYRSSGLMITRVASGKGAKGSVFQSFVYSVNVRAGWRMAVTAATGSDVFFYDPASVILYTTDNVMVAGKALPAREQGIGTKPMTDTYYLGSVEEYLQKGVSEPFRVVVPVSGMKEPITLNIPVLSTFLTQFGSESMTASTAYYAAVKEIGVDEEVKAIFGVVSSYMGGDDKIAADKAASWLIVHLSPLMRSPVIVAMAERAINAAFYEAGLDARRLASQMNEVKIRALLAVVLVALNRFNKITAAQLNKVIRDMPVHTLSLHASMSMATLPSVYKR